jgi:hypothetical protein
MSALGTELPIRYLNASVAIGGKADPDQTILNKLFMIPHLSRLNKSVR